jgi:hypothetical protein
MSLKPSNSSATHKAARTRCFCRGRALKESCSRQYKLSLCDNRSGSFSRPGVWPCQLPFARHELIAFDGDEVLAGPRPRPYVHGIGVLQGTAADCKCGERSGSARVSGLFGRLQ